LEKLKDIQIDEIETEEIKNINLENEVEGKVTDLNNTNKELKKQIIDYLNKIKDLETLNDIQIEKIKIEEIKNIDLKNEVEGKITDLKNTNEELRKEIID